MTTTRVKLGDHGSLGKPKGKRKGKRGGGNGNNI